MPRIKRWFPVSHDFNADPELWELTDAFGDRALRVWFECLSIADRNEGELPGPWIAYPSILAGRCKSTARHLRVVCEWLTRWLDVDSQGIARVRNYAKYHRTQEQNPLPPDHTRPNRTYKDIQTTLAVVDPDSFSVKDLVESWNESFSGKLPCVQWPLSPGRQRKAGQRLKEHSLIAFWQQVFNNISTSAFLLGANNGTWRCTLDFLIANDSNCLKIYEGAYNGKTHA